MIILKKMEESSDNEVIELRSISNDIQSYVKFINKTQHEVDLYWIDYQGRAVKYGLLMPNRTKDINTFVTHPWIFVDNKTLERYTVNQKDVFFPEPWYCKYPDLRRDEIPDRIERTVVYITLPIYTLREICFRVIRKYLTHKEQAYLLDIPRCLQRELAAMLP